MKTFLASVGYASLFVKSRQGLFHLADARTLTDSSLSFTNSMEEIRCGSGAKLRGRFSHTSGLSIKLTDVMFDMNYLAAVLGRPENGTTSPTAWYYDYAYGVDEDGLLDLSYTPANIGSVCGLNYAPIWVLDIDDACGGDAEWRCIEPDSEGHYYLTQTDSVHVCIKYFTEVPQASSLKVAGVFAPQELVLLLTTSLYSASSNNDTEKNVVGEITIKIPRFQLDGTLDLSFAMASNTPIQLSGVALAGSTLSCPTDSGDTYGEIVEVVYFDKWYNGLRDIALDPETEQLYGEYWDGHVSILSSDLEGITAFYNEQALVLYTVNIPQILEIIPVNPSPSLEYDQEDENYVVGPDDFAYSGMNIRNGTTFVGDYAFSDNEKIEVVFCPESLKGIGEGAFQYCEALTTVYIPNSVTSIGEYAFDSCGSLRSATIGNSVTSIGGNAFAYCTSLTSIAIPNSVESIGEYAFAWCTSLTSITIPNSVTSIGREAFSACQNLASITVVEGNAVYHSAGNCIIETATKTLIAGCKNSVIPTDGSVTSIGQYAFSYCASLASIAIPDGVTSIGGSAFSHCASLASIAIPDGVTSIGNYAFWNCTSLSSITIPNSVTSIGQQAFSHCTSLASIEIPNSVTSIGNRAFYNCPIQAATIPAVACSSINNNSLKTVVITSGTSIGGNAFYNCTSLTSIEIPDSVTSIGGSAFRGCTSLTSITIPNSVESIGGNAFNYCSSLVRVESMAQTPPVLSNSVFNNTNNCPIYVLYSQDHSILQAYKTATNWAAYADRIFELPEDYQ